MYWLNCLSLGLRCLKTAVSCSQMMSQLKNYQCHWYWCSLLLSFQRGSWADREDSLVVVSDTGCKLAGWESLGDGCGSLRSECLVVTLVCLIGMSRSGSVTFSLKFLLFLVEVSRLGCLLGGIGTVLVTGLSSNLVILACLLSWTLLSGTVSETKTWDVLVCLILPLRFPERTSCCDPEMTEFSFLDGAFLSLVAERTELHCKKEAWICGVSGLLGLMWERFLVSCPPVASTCVS